MRSTTLGRALAACVTDQLLGSWQPSEDRIKLRADHQTGWVEEARSVMLNGVLNRWPWLRKLFRAVRLYGPTVDPLGPVFLSYRQSGGSGVTAALATSFRAWGIPVWHDRKDLPPGDWERSIQAALEAGLSGGVLVFTPEVGESEVVREIELPALLRLARAEAFSIAILNTVSKGASPDYAPPDSLLLPGERPRLDKVKQDGVGDIQALTRDMAMQRMALWRRRGGTQLILDDPTYITGVKRSARPTREDVASLSASVTAALLAQFVSLVAGAGGRGDPGPL